MEIPHLQSIPAVLAVTPLVIGHGSKQLVASFSTAGAYLPNTQVSQEAASEKDTSGLDMYLPLGQQPSRALPRLEPDKVDHLPPHNVRLNPLSRNTEKEEKDKIKEDQIGMLFIRLEKTTFMNNSIQKNRKKQ